MNLLSNAIKFAPRGTSVDVNIDQSASEDMLKIEVSDRGPGISPADLKKLFEPYGRLYSG